MKRTLALLVCWKRGHEWSPWVPIRNYGARQSQPVVAEARFCQHWAFGKSQCRTYDWKYIDRRRRP
jgi:hypothetical protein